VVVLPCLTCSSSAIIFFVAPKPPPLNGFLVGTLAGVTVCDLSFGASLTDLSTAPVPYTLHPTPYTLHPTPYTLHPTPYTLHPPSPKP
jgi:hypothetical protein